ncbi:MAG: ABC transporter ATP-binding protein [Kiritimatiellae bacterium]|nr:ABC transporter ATP-binding protein [Kiritimatiellia bacterium]
MIAIEHLTKTFGALQAVKDLSLAIPRGELFCFLGPNGAGKTTTIKLLCGLLKPTGGTIRIQGIDIQADPAAVRRLIGYIPDTPFLYERLTPAEFFQFIGDLHRVPPERVEATRARFFPLFAIEEYAQTLIKDLSHGYRQRLIYAATFLHQPEVLFIDEPFVGLDPFSIRLIRDLLRERARSGTTIFLTTHILAFAEQLADRIGIIAGGSLVGLGTLAELRARSSVQGPLEDIFLRLTRPEG